MNTLLTVVLSHHPFHVITICVAIATCHQNITINSLTLPNNVYFFFIDLKIHHSPYYGMSFPKSWIHSLVQLLERHNLKRVALLVESTDCTKQNVTVSLTKKLEIAGIFLHMTCVDLYSTIDLTIWRHLHTAIYLSMTTIISFVTPDTAFLLVEAGELLGMLTAHLYTWIFFELTSPQVKDFRLTFPNFYFNNVKTVRLLTNTSLRNTIISTTVEGECFLL